MGCANSVDGGEPSGPKNRSTMNKRDEKVKQLPAIDQKRVQLILDYWYDEGIRDGSSGNSLDYR